MKTPQELLQQALEAGECLLPDASPSIDLKFTATRLLYQVEEVLHVLFSIHFLLWYLWL